jgi:deoxyribonuclease IV
MLLGVHCSVAGGFENAFIEAERLEIDTFQIFSRNQRQWQAKPITESEQLLFTREREKSLAKVQFSHASYLINLGSSNDEIWEKSVQALIAEMERCELLGLSYCVLHPGAAGTQSLDEALVKIAAGLSYVIQNTEGSNAMILLENTAGQGSSVGGTFENLGILKRLVNHERIGFCFDTCHAYAAGYDLRTVSGFEDTMGHFDKVAGLRNLKVFHLNDSKGDLGSHLDRHEHIAQGKLGSIPFQQIMRNFQHIPKVLETPKENDMDMVNLKFLRNLI